MLKSKVRPSTALLALLCLTAFLQSCTFLQPNYVRPDAPIPRDYSKEDALLGTGVENLTWQEFFTDPVTRNLIATALENNRSLRVALLNIEKVRAQYRIQRADLLPTVAAAADYSAQRVPADMSMTGQTYIQRQYSASLGFSAFELDLFGRVRSLTDAALETYYSVEDDARAARISLMAEVAGMYLQLVSDRELLDITRATYHNRRGQYELVRNKYNSGVASQLEVSQAQSIMEEARSNVSRYATRVEQAENALQLLLGAPLPEEAFTARKLSQIKMLADIPEGLPSQLLERRPDIRAAEHRLKAASANIGAARANFFPTISLTGAVGTISNEASQLFAGGSGFWSFLPQVSLPIFDTGRNLATLGMTEAQRDMAVAEYESTIQSAFREVMDTLVQRKYIGEQLLAETALLRSTSTSYNLASARYDVGVDSYLNVLDAQRSLYSAQQSYISTKLLRETNVLTLFKALGGGWQERAEVEQAAAEAASASQAAAQPATEEAKAQ